MSTVIAVAAQKGGVGKTTTALNLGYALGRLGRSVLVIDCDPQGGIAAASNLRERTARGLVELLKGEAQPADVCVLAKKARFGVVGFGGAGPRDVQFYEERVRRGLLRQAVRALAGDFEYVLLDGPPGLGVPTRAVLEAAHALLLPVTAQAYTLRSLPSFLRLVREVRGLDGAPLRLEGVLVTQLDYASAVEKSLLEEMRAAFPPTVFYRTRIPYDPQFERAGMHGVPVALLRDGAAAARHYGLLAMEFEERLAVAPPDGEGTSHVEDLF